MPQRGNAGVTVLRLLGPVRLEVNGRAVDLGPAEQRCLLAVLAMSPGHPVAAQTLAGRIWGDSPPVRARKTVATYAARLRRILEAAGCPPDLLRIRFASGAYVVQCDPELVDLHRARGLVNEAKIVDGDAAAADRYDQALAGWQPTALAGLSGDWAERVRAGLHDEYLDVLARWAQAKVRLGTHDAVIDRLQPVFAQYPTAEALAAPLMTALLRTNRTAQLQDCYRLLRQAAADTLGAEPSPHIQEIHRQSLRAQSPAAVGPAAPAAPAAPVAPVASAAPVAPAASGGGEPEDRQDGLELLILGPIEVRVHGVPVLLRRRQERCLLAVLAMEPGRFIPVTRLTEVLWDGTPPAGARSAIQAMVSHLRAVLGGTARLVHQGGGYALHIDPDRVDLHRFRTLIERGRAAPSAAARAALLAEALGLWRGVPLAGMLGDAQRERLCSNLTALHLTARQEWVDARLELGRAVVEPLTRMIDEHPLDERLRAQLMLALYRRGRRADALDAYQRARDVLVREVGLEPGPELQALHRDILADAPTLARTALAPAPAEEPADAAEATSISGTALPMSGRAPAGPALFSPRQLPAPPQLFTGRDTELVDLEKIHDPSTVVITAIDGMAGVGKTALAVQAAHQMVDRYPDGQLFLDLHGYTQGVAPVEPGDALDSMLRALGVPGESIPADREQRAGLYRSRLADRRMLIVLDNAATEAQVTPLLPGAPGCVVLVTSRRRLVGLDHTHMLSLDTLPPHDAIALFRRSVSESRLAGQPPEVVAELVELCGRLPLAIRIAAARLRSHPTWTLAHLTQRLRDRRHRLAELTARQRSVTAALDLSYHDLSTDEQRTYRLLGLHPGADVEPYAAAALLDATVEEAGRLLEQLLDAHLLHEPVPGRCRFHDLIRAHAADTATRDETDHTRRGALDRLLDYYRHTAAVAADGAYPYERERRPQVPAAATPSPPLSDPAAALGWLDGELPNLLAAARYATEHGRPAHLLHLSTIVHRHLRTHGHYHDAVALHQQALTTARATGHQTAELEALVGLGHIHRLQGRYEDATDHLQRALRLAHATGHQAVEPDAFVGLAWIHRLQGRYEHATDQYQQALRLARTTGHHPAELNALTGLGHLDLRQGRSEQATHHFQQALRLARTTGNHPAELNALTGLGNIHLRQGRYERATDHYRQALRLAQVTGHRTGELQTLASLADIHRLQGQYEPASDHYQRLLDLAHRYRNRNYQFEARQGLGRLGHATGHPQAALTHHRRALALAGELGQPDDQARAHDGLAHAHYALHQPEQARTHWQHALDILTGLGIDHTDEEDTNAAAIRTHLANLDHDEAAAATD